jgi:hypothetical protein
MIQVEVKICHMLANKSVHKHQCIAVNGELVKQIKCLSFVERKPNTKDLSVLKPVKNLSHHCNLSADKGNLDGRGAQTRLADQVG